MEQISVTPVEKKKPKVVAKVAKVSSILDASDKLRRNSLKLRKTFENGTYQKRTQLSVLKRYKRRLDSIELENERVSKRKSRKKINLPSIKKFSGNFFAPGASDDPLKAIGALAAFNAATKAFGGDLLGALGPALVAGGSIFGPALVGGGIGGMMNMGRKSPKGFDKFGKKVSSKSQERYFQRYGEKAFKNRFGKDNLKNIQNVTEGPKIGKAFGRFGKAIIPGVGAAVGAIDATLRAQEGDVTGSTIAGTSASLDALAAASAATGIGLPVAGLLSIASFGLDVVNLVRDLTGTSEKEIQTNKPKKDALNEQTEKQKKLIEQEPKSAEKLTFGKTLNHYEKVINKFENFAKGFSVGMGMTEEQIRQTSARIENLGGGSTPISSAGYEFTNQSSFAQYLTGDPNAPGDAYDPSHGTPSNYHDHLAFKDADTARRAYNFLKSKGIKVTELQGVDAGVTGPHSGSGSAHHRGLAFDVPGYQWGGSGAVGEKEYAGSAKVRSFMNDFYNLQTKQSPQNQKQNQVDNISSYGQLLKKDVKKKLISKGSIPFQHNGQTYYLNYTEDGPSIYKNRDPLGVTREYYDSSGQKNRELQLSAIQKIESMYSNAIQGKQRGPNFETPTAPQVTTPTPQIRPIEYYPSYDSRSQRGQVIPIPIPVQEQQQKIVQGGSSKITILPGPSEEEVLNSFYKRVLLNTLQ